MKKIHNNFFNLAFNLAKINLGKTKTNPVVGCIIVKNGCVISSGFTSLNGRPHAEFNALNKKLNFKGSDLYVTMEPCTHHGLTPPCTNIITQKKIKNVFFSFNDVDKRTSRKSQLVLLRKGIKVFKDNNKIYNNFYQSYFINKTRKMPLIDAKLALSKDFFSIHKEKKWITNIFSRTRAHLIRSEYDSIISTATSMNKDNSLLNCRLEGFDNNKPDLIIIDLSLKIKTNLSFFKLLKKRKTFIVTSSNDVQKIYKLKKRGIKFINISSLSSKKDFIILFKLLKKRGFNRILVETGLNFLNELLRKKLVYNLYLFKTSIKLGSKGLNNCSINFIKKLKTMKKIKVNLNGDNLYKVKIK